MHPEFVVSGPTFSLSVPPIEESNFQFIYCPGWSSALNQLMHQNSGGGTLPVTQIWQSLISNQAAISIPTSLVMQTETGKLKDEGRLVSCTHPQITQGHEPMGLFLSPATGVEFLLGVHKLAQRLPAFSSIGEERCQAGAHLLDL